jgi:hypothetical protein
MATVPDLRFPEIPAKERVIGKTTTFARKDRKSAKVFFKCTMGQSLNISCFFELNQKDNAVFLRYFLRDFHAATQLSFQETQMNKTTFFKNDFHLSPFGRGLLARYFIALFLGFAPVFANAQLAAGDVLVSDLNIGSSGGVLKVDSTSGTRTVLSDFGDTQQGVVGSGPFSLAVESADSVLALDPAANKLFRINTSTGMRAVLSDFSNAAQGTVVDGMMGDGVLGLAVEKSGNVLVTAKGAGSADNGSTAYRDALLRVDKTTGQRTRLSDFGDPAQGPLGGQCTFGVVVEATGSILVSDCNNLGSGAGGLLFRIDPITGQRQLLSDFGDPAQGQSAQHLAGIALESSGKIVVASAFAGSGGGGALFRVDPVSGQRVLLSDFGNPAQGATGSLLRNVAVDAAGAILVTDQDVDDIIGPGGGALFRVDPNTGARTIISDFANLALGPGSAPVGVASYQPAAAPVGNLAGKLLLMRASTDRLRFFAEGTFILPSAVAALLQANKEALVLSISGKNGGIFSQSLPAGALKPHGKGLFIFKTNAKAAGIHVLVLKRERAGQFRVLVVSNPFKPANQPAQPVKFVLQIGSHSFAASMECGKNPHLLLCRSR